MRNKKTLFVGITVLIMLLVLTSCLPGHVRFEVERPAGFFMGIWHGWMAPISLVVSLFKPAVHIYEVSNTGWWYDFGFYMAIISGFGGLSLGRKKVKSPGK
jgi:hypothetical protein